MNKGFYCSANKAVHGYDDEVILCSEMNCILCPSYHRKYPTLDQFRKEYGREWEGAVYHTRTDKPGYGWHVEILQKCVREHMGHDDLLVICACTPFIPDEETTIEE